MLEPTIEKRLKNSRALLSISLPKFVILLALLMPFGVSNALAQSPIKINEIMYAPDTSEPEWIELINTGPDTLTLTNWSIYVKTKTTALGEFIIPPSGFIVVSKNSAKLRAAHGDHPFTIQVAPLPSLANAGDIVTLSDNFSNTIDSIHYYPAWGGSKGTSLERISISRPSTDSTNWGSSISKYKSTPGLPNSIIPVERDLGIKTQAFFANDTLTIEDTLFNRGTADASAAILYTYRDENHDSTFSTNEIMDSVWVGPIAHGSSLTIDRKLTKQPLSALYYESRIALDSDQVAANDTATFGFGPGLALSSVVLNEVMYAPSPSEPEWIELYNRSTDTIDLFGCTIHTHDAGSSPMPKGSFIAPQAFLILTKSDSALVLVRQPQTSVAHIIQIAVPDLPNSGGSIGLNDARGETIDTLIYKPAWGGASGRSLERIDFDLTALDSTNLHETLDTSGATLGLPNSVRKRTTDLALDSLSYSQRDSIVELSVILQNKGRSRIDTASISIVLEQATQNELLLTETIFPHIAPATSDTEHITFPISQYGVSHYFVFCETPRDSLYSNDTLTFSNTVAVPRDGLALNEIMLAPISSSSQWIELYNREALPIETSSLTLKVFSAGTLHNLPFPAATIPSHSFAILAADSNFYDAYPSLMNRATVCQLSRASLEFTATSEMQLTISNHDSSIIDSFASAPDWLPTMSAGTSLERISRARSALDSTNWLLSVAAAGATPLAENSVSARPDTSIGAVRISATPNPFSPDGDGIDDVTQLSFTTGSPVECNVRLRLFDSRGRVVRTLTSDARYYLTGELLFDGKSDNGTALPIGVYTTLLECTDPSGSVHSARTGVVIAKRVR